MTINKLMIWSATLGSFSHPSELPDPKMGAGLDFLSDIGTPAEKIVLDGGENNVGAPAFLVATLVVVVATLVVVVAGVDFLSDTGTPAEKIVLDRGENTVVVAHTVWDMDPDEPVNMKVLLAFEWTQAAPRSFHLKDTAL